MNTEGIRLTFTPEAIKEIAALATQVNERTENIGARRLHTVMEKLLEEISFTAPDLAPRRSPSPTPTSGSAWPPSSKTRI